ncbi:MAG TPA: hypothetical protein DEO84_12065, partial [candidate division Zixibacteria bacterium]|nr:hypothetical protein [candidate division Zixibacteria bacterium]
MKIGLYWLIVVATLMVYCSSNEPSNRLPVIEDISLYPTPIVPGQITTVLAHIYDTDGIITQADLVYDNGTNEYTVHMDTLSGFYYASIPPLRIETGIFYHIVALNAHGQSSSPNGYFVVQFYQLAAYLSPLA